jgi:DNA helicase-2/ATP-dependent DNA helicase PcrA
MNNNKLIIAAAGSGKTTYLVHEALQAPPSENILITTYTEANEAGIKKMIIKLKGYIPANITIQTWFSFLLQHGVRPFQGSMNDSLWKNDITGMLLSEGQSGIKYSFVNGAGKKINVQYKENEEFVEHYFAHNMKIYSDKISKFIVDCDKKTQGAIISRLVRIYSNIFIDEVQDLAGYDFEILKLLFKSPSFILLVGDPRQVTYLTHHSTKYKKYADGRIKEFLENELGKKVTCTVDEKTLNSSHRNNQIICDYSGKLFPNLPVPIPCECASCRQYDEKHEGIFLIKTADIDYYLQNYKSIQLRWSSSKEVNNEFEVINFGASKGLTFERVLIYPTADMIMWIKNNKYNLKNTSRAKFYVGITRAKYSVGIVMDYSDKQEYSGIKKFVREEH